MVKAPADKRLKPNDMSNTKPIGANITIQPNGDKPVSPIRRDNKEGVAAKKYAVTAVADHARNIQEKTLATKVLATFTGSAFD